MTAIIIQKSFNLQYNRIINEAEDNEHDENSKNQVNNSEETVDDVIDKETYKKIKEASEKIKEIIQGE